jgi:hypothetical protein
MPGRNETLRKPAETPASHDWAGLFLALSRRGHARQQESQCKGQVLTPPDGGGGHDGARALLLKLIALRLAPARG